MRSARQREQCQCPVHDEYRLGTTTEKPHKNATGPESACPVRSTFAPRASDVASAGDVDGLELGETDEAPSATFDADTAPLQPAERLARYG